MSDIMRIVDDPVFRLIVALAGNSAYADKETRIIIADAKAIYEHYLEVSNDLLNRTSGGPERK